MRLEPNNILTDAIDSSVGFSEKRTATFESSIENKSDVDLYQFQLNKGQGITIDIDTVSSLKSNDNFDSYLRIFNADGQELALNDDFSLESEAFSLDSYLGFIANATGEYYVGISDTTATEYNPLEAIDNDVNLLSRNFVEAKYTIDFDIVEIESDVDPDNTIAEATALSIDRQTKNAVLNGEIQTELDVDLYEIELGEAEGIELNIEAQTNDSELDSYLRIFDANGKELAFNDNSEDPDNITLDSDLIYAPQTSGIYYVGVSSAGKYDYDAVNGDTNLNFSPNTGISSGSYQLQLEVVDVIQDNDPNNAIAEAVDTEVGSTDSNSPVTKSGEIDSEFDVDIFKFQLQEAEGIQLDINTSKLASDLDSYLRIFDSEGNELRTDDNNDANFTGDFSFDSNLAFLPDAPGEYYVGVGTSGNFDYDPISGRTNFSSDKLSPFATTGSYELVLNPIEVVGDVDVDNTIAEAVDSGIGEETPVVEIAGAIDRVNDVDFYKLQLNSGEGVTFDINTAKNDSDLDSYIRLFDSQGRQLAFDNDNDNYNDFDATEDFSFDSLLRFAPDLSGEYFIAVSSDGNTDFDPVNGSNNFTPITGFTTGSYSLAVSVTDVVYDTDADNTIAKAINTEVAVGEQPSTINNAIDSTTDADLYQFALNRGDTVSIDVDAAEIDSELDSVLRIFDADGQELIANDDKSAPGETSELDSHIEFTALTTGTYYAGVSSYDNFNYDVINGSNDFSNNFGTTTGNYNLVIGIAE